jgi:hypothetical protein
MRKRGEAWLALLLLWPLAAAAADEVELPELAVRLTALPVGAGKPEVTQSASGYEATTHVGAAALRIIRQSEPVPAGSDVADPNYRASLDTKFDSAIDSKSHGAPTAVGGHSAWTVVEARESGSATVYTCVTYVIVASHLYRLSVSATGERGRPPEFDSLVLAMSGVRFEVAPHTELPASQTAQRLRQRYVLNTLRAGGNDRQDHLRRMPTADIDAVARDTLGARASFGLSGVGVHVEAREIAA